MDALARVRPARPYHARAACVRAKRKPRGKATRHSPGAGILGGAWPLRGAHGACCEVTSGHQQRGAEITRRTYAAVAAAGRAGPSLG